MDLLFLPAFVYAEREFLFALHEIERRTGRELVRYTPTNIMSKTLGEFVDFVLNAPLVKQVS
jgi:hypothetical protein